MSEKDLIYLEEVLLGYLRSSQKIKLTNIDVVEQEDKNKYTITFNIDKNFASTLVNNLNNQFTAFFNANTKDNERKTS